MNGENICIVCITPAFANAGGLQRALDCNIVAQKHDFKGFHKLCTRPLGSTNNIPEAKHYIFAGSGILLRVDVSKLKGRKTVIISDSHYLQNTAEIDKIIEDHEIEVFCMIDLWKFCKHEKKAYFQPFEPFEIDIKKNEQITVCHSPSVKFSTNQKGSAQIGRAVDAVINKRDVNYLCITNDTWSEAVKKKSTAHIFVDQLVMSNHYSSIGYEGGIGKSGLEGMLLKCLTISCGTPIETDIPAPPYVVANNVEELEEAILGFTDNKIARNAMIKKQYSWAKKYTSPEMVAKRILE
jgi:hypothetical protein